jgi:hypothetical protein
MLTVPAAAVTHLAALIESYCLTANETPDDIAYSIYNTHTAEFILLAFHSSLPEPIDQITPGLYWGWHITPNDTHDLLGHITVPASLNIAALTHFVHYTDTPFPSLLDILANLRTTLLPLSIAEPLSVALPTQEDRHDMPIAGSLQQCLKYARVLFDTHDYTQLHIIFHLETKDYHVYTPAELSRADTLGKLGNLRHTACLTTYELAVLETYGSSAPKGKQDAPLPA